MLFPEVEEIKKKYNENGDRRLCYLIVMLLMDDCYKDIFENSLDDVSNLDERSFLEEHYYFCVQIFPNAKSVFDKSKFIEEDE